MELQDPYLSVIIPAYNEGKRIIKTLQIISEYLRGKPFSYEILVVSDGSKDDTVDIVERLIPQIPNLRVIGRKQNKGKGYTVREGMMVAKGKIRLFTDADNSTDISYFDKMQPLFDKGNDVVISSRDPKDVEGASQEISQAWWKMLLGNMGNLYIQVLAVPGIWDTQNGFKAFRGHVADKLFRLAKIDRWAIDVEILALARKFKYKIAIIPIRWKNDTGSNVSLMGYFKTLWEVAKIRWNLIKRNYE